MPSLPRIQAQGSSAGRRATAADFGALEGQAREQRAGIFGQLGGAAAEVVEIRNRIREGADQAQLGLAAAQHLAATRRSVFDAEQDTDLDTLEERFEKSGQALRDEHRKALPPALHQAFEARVFPVEQNARLDVAQSVSHRRTGKARASADEMVRIATDEAARAGPVQRGQIAGQTVGTLQGLLEAGILDQAGFNERKLKLERGISEADYLAALAADPGEAFRELADPSSPLAAGITEAQRLERRAGAQRAFEQELREDREAENHERIQRERAEKDQADEALKDVQDLMTSGDLAGAQQTLRGARDVLSAEQYTAMTRRLAGEGKEPKTVPAVFVDLVNRAGGGAPIREEANNAYLRGDLTQADRDQVVKMSEDKRFAPAVDFASQSMRQGLFDFDPAFELKSAEVQRQVADWIRLNPDATVEAADKQTRDIVRTFGQKETTRLQKPGDPGSNTGKVDIAAAGAAVMAQFAIDGDAQKRDAELKRLDELERAQQLGTMP